MLKLMSSVNSYLGTSYLPGAIIAILILIFKLNILIPDDVDNSLFSVLNTNFPPLDQQIPKEGAPINMCNPDLDTNTTTNTNTTAIPSISIVTNQPSNVLEVASSSNKIIGGGKRKISMPKQKLYKIKLV
jgi:hypothetical protein